MQTEDTPAPPAKPLLWIGWILTILPVLMLVMSGVMKLTKSEDVVKGFEHLGWPDNLAVALAIVELTSAVLYVIPQTAVLGAILVTGYLGGAIATHVRIGEHTEIAIPIVLGAVIWLALLLRDARLRRLLPLRT
jgi:uncharacterized membrane protein YphA (DoxX/SURF4 family)